MLQLGPAQRLPRPVDGLGNPVEAVESPLEQGEVLPARTEIGARARNQVLGLEPTRLVTTSIPASKDIGERCIRFLQQIIVRAGLTQHRGKSAKADLQSMPEGRRFIPAEVF